MGIGEAMAFELAKGGASLALLSRSEVCPSTIFSQSDLAVADSNRTSSYLSAKG